MRFISKHQLQEEFSILQVISEINSTAVRVIHRFVSSHLTSSILLSRGLSSGEKALMRPNWGETKLSRPSNRSWRTGRNRGGRRPGREPRGGRRIPWEIRFKYHVEEGQRMIFDHCCQGVFYVDAQRNMAVTMGERDVKMDVKEKSRLLIFSVWWTMITGWFRRDKYLSSAMVEGDTAESYIAQVRWRRRRREMRVKLKSPGPDWDEEDV